MGSITAIAFAKPNTTSLTCWGDVRRLDTCHTREFTRNRTSSSISLAGSRVSGSFLGPLPVNDTLELAHYCSMLESLHLFKSSCPSCSKFGIDFLRIF